MECSVQIVVTPQLAKELARGNFEQAFRNVIVKRLFSAPVYPVKLILKIHEESKYFSIDENWALEDGWLLEIKEFIFQHQAISELETFLSDNP